MVFLQLNISSKEKRLSCDKETMSIISTHNKVMTSKHNTDQSAQSLDGLGTNL